MACYSPLRGYRSRFVNPSGKRSIVFKPREGFADMEVQLPCGRCIGCKLEKSRQWAVRIMHEAKQHEFNYFLTLTYNPENLPQDGSLVPKHFQDFMKRLRHYYGTGIRFYQAGEYGDKTKRPYYHACLFNLKLDDLRYHGKSPSGFPLYRSERINEIWGKGHVIIGEVTFESAAYVARYVTKKATGPQAIDRYLTIDPETGEIIKEIKPEFSTMSRRPGIGKTFYEEYNSEMYPLDRVIVQRKGKYVRQRPPRYYDYLHELANPEEMLKIKEKRKRAAKDNAPDNTSERLHIKEQIQYIRANKLIRSYDETT